MLQVLFLNIISPCLSWLGSELRGRSSGQSPKEYWNTSTRYLFLTVTGQIHGELAYPIQVCFESICVRVIVIFKILMPMKCNLYEWMNVILDLKAIGNFFKNQFSCWANQNIFLVSWWLRETERLMSQEMTSVRLVSDTVMWEDLYYPVLRFSTTNTEIVITESWLFGPPGPEGMLAVWFIFTKLEISLSVPSTVSGVFVQTDRTHGQDRNRGTFLCVWRLASELDPPHSAQSFLLRKVGGLMVLLWFGSVWNSPLKSEPLELRCGSLDSPWHALLEVEMPHCLVVLQVLK